MIDHTAVTILVIKSGIKISEDGKGTCRDNIFIERIWKSVRYEEISAPPARDHASMALDRDPPMPKPDDLARHIDDAQARSFKDSFGA